MAHDDKFGEIKKDNLTDKEYMNDVMHFLNSLAKKTATYKYAFFKAILDNLFNIDNNYQLSFDLLLISFSKQYWNLVAKYDLPQYQNTKNRKSGMENIVKEFIEKDNLLNGIDYDSLGDNIKRKYLSRTDKVMKLNVIGALYDELNGDIYGFDKSIKRIWFSESSYNFLINYKSALEKLNYYGWIQWMDNILTIRGGAADNISSKLDESTKRENLDKFKNELLAKGDIPICFYCGSSVINKCHMDHFVPWSFVKDDQVWNLVFSCSRCNESKNNKLPAEEYLVKIFDRNEKVLAYNYKKELNRLYSSAKHNGFIPWERRD